MILTDLNKLFKALDIFDPLYYPSYDLLLNNTADVINTDTEYVVKVDVPGFKKEDINVDTSDLSFRITGIRERDSAYENKHYTLSERLFGKLDRTFKLPRNVDVNTVKASLDNGVLTVCFAKTERTNSKKINID